MRPIGGGGPMLAQRVAIRRVGIDDYSDVRYLHARSLLAHTTETLSEPEVAAYIGLVYSPAYGDILAAEDLHGAFKDGQLVGTASWQANGDDGKVARISAVFVHPLFVRLGIGRRLVAEVEARALQSGFDHFSISAIGNSVPFFEKLGYEMSSRGVKTVGPGCALPVAFLRKRVPRRVRAPHTPAA